MTEVVTAVTEDLPEILSIYEQSFRASERVPSAALASSLGQQRQCFVLRRASRVVAFAVMLHLDTETTLLEYMAVAPNSRGSGLGTEMLTHLRQAMLVSVLFEVEDPLEAVDEEEATRRHRRVAFYTKRGCRPVPCDLSYKPPSFDNTPAARLLLYTLTPQEDWSMLRTAQTFLAIARGAYNGA